MRPNIDVPWSQHGKIKQYSEKENISIEDTYLKLLETGLDSVGTVEEPRLQRASPTETTFIPCFENVHGTVCTFHPYTLSGSFAFRTADTTQSLERVEHVLAELQQFAGISSDRGVFTVQQSNGLWIGHGLSAFFDTLGDQQDRYEEVPENFTLKTHNSEAALFVTSVPAGPGVAPRGPSTITISAQPAVDGNAINHFRIAIATSGIPVDPQAIDALGNRIGIDIGYGQQREPFHISVPRNKCAELEIQPVRKITDKNYGEEWVIALICENPFYRKPGKLMEYLEEGTDSGRDLTYLQRYLLYNEHIWSDLVHQHRARKQPEYVGRTLKIDNLDKIGGSGFGTVNLYFASTYLD